MLGRDSLLNSGLTQNSGPEPPRTSTVQRIYLLGCRDELRHRCELIQALMDGEH